MKLENFHICEVFHNIELLTSCLLINNYIVNWCWRGHRSGAQLYETCMLCPTSSFPFPGPITGEVQVSMSGTGRVSPVKCLLTENNQGPQNYFKGKKLTQGQMRKHLKLKFKQKSVNCWKSTRKSMNRRWNSTELRTSIGKPGRERRCIPWCLACRQGQLLGWPLRPALLCLWSWPLIGEQECDWLTLYRKICPAGRCQIWLCPCIILR